MAPAEADDRLDLVAPPYRPMGLCGWQNRRTRVAGVTAASICSRGSRHPLPVRSLGTIDGRATLVARCGRKGGYAGVIIITASPGAAKALHTRFSAGTALGRNTSHSGRTCQP